LEPHSKVAVDNFLQDLKHDPEIASIDEGMQIDVSDKQYSNTDLPRFKSLQPHSNVTVDSFVQPLKHDAEIVSTDEGTQMD
jgi:hypothetical protein